MQTSHSYHRGFTFVELILYIGMLSIVMVGLIYFVTDITSSSTKSGALSEVEYATRFAGERIGRETMGAIGINTAQSTFGASPGTLSLQTRDAVTNPTIVQLVGTSVMIKQGARATETITTSLTQITNLTFFNLSQAGTSNVIQFSLTGKRTNPQSMEEFGASTTIIGTATLRQ